MVYAVLGGDMRQLYLAQQLKNDGNEVTVWGTYKEKCGEIKQKKEYDTAISGADVVILPLPAEKNGEINGGDGLKLEELLEVLRPTQILLGGKLSGKFMEKAKDKKILTIDYYEYEELIIANAAITAEGAVQILLNESKQVVSGMKCLIVGGGRIGKFTALKLRAMGADVSVSVRKNEDEILIRELGLKPVKTEELPDIIGEYETVINTVPAKVIDTNSLEKIKNGTILIDLASEPGGFNYETAEKMKIKIIKALSLPGKTAPVSAAAAIKDTIYNIISKAEI